MASGSRDDSAVERLQQCLVENAQLRLKIDSLESSAEDAIRSKNELEREENEQLTLLQRQLEKFAKRVLEAIVTNN